MTWSLEDQEPLIYAWRVRTASRGIGRMITIPQSELLPRGDHASLTICGFIQSVGWSMIDIIPSGKR